MYGIERQSEILKLLEQNGRAGVNELSGLLQASRETIRRDLREMEQKGLLKRTHGGAVFESGLAAAPEFPVGVREIQKFKEKNAICRCAATFLQDGDTVFVDNSSTCLSLVRYIPADLHITLITNSLKLLMGSLESTHPGLLLVCLGGFFNGSNLSTYGSLSQRNAADLYPSKAFMSCAGIQFPGQVTDASLLEVDTKRLMIEHSREVFILADYSKFERSGPVFLTGFQSIHTLITDPSAPPAQCAAIEKSGVKLVRARLD
jgi:DeoR family transcriptional regulator, fructose operon transcriptional repressor